MKTKTISIALLVVLASLAITGLVLATHTTPSLVFSEGSIAALNQYDRDYQAHMAIALNETNASEEFSTGRRMELNEEAVRNFTMESINEKRLQALAEGYRARLQLELDEEAARNSTTESINEKRLQALAEGYRARLQLEWEQSAAFASSSSGSSYGDWFLIEHFADFGR